MSFFDNIYQKIFPSDSNDSVEIHELIRRSKEYLARYDQWCNGNRKSEVLKAISTAITLKEKGIEQEPVIHLLNISGSSGFAVSASNFFEKNEFQFLADLFLESVLEEFDYVKMNSDVKILEKKGAIETKEKYYLKPKKHFTQPINQIFGNILIENTVLNNTPNYLKVTASAYNDRNYSKPLSFQGLQDNILFYE